MDLGYLGNTMKIFGIKKYLLKLWNILKAKSYSDKEKQEIAFKNRGRL